MSFISLRFVIFFIFTLIIGSIIQRKSSYDNYLKFLLISNLLFYSFNNWKVTIILMLLIIYTYYCSLNISNKVCYYSAIILPLILLGFFKYYNFFLTTINKNTLDIILPLGISFYTFELISYIVDIKRGKTNYEKDFIRFATYISFFPNLISGPIERASNLLVQIQKEKRINIDDFKVGIQIMAIGYFKKMVLADRLSVFVNDVYNYPGLLHWLTILLGIFSYSLQIYFDFSGYSDIAIGCARCFGFKLKKNFNLPYASKSITEFWRRWHISLSSWFKDYVYIPLGGNRKGLARQLINQLIVMTLSGLWHGAAWNYVLWGLLNGILLVIEKALKLDSGESSLRIITNFIIVSFTWVLFRAESIDKMHRIFNALFTLQNGIIQPYAWSFVAFVISIVYLVYVSSKKQEKMEYIYPIQDLNTIKGLTLFFIFLGLIICLAYANTNPFVYFQF